MWDILATVLPPVITGALWSIPLNQKTYIKKIEIKPSTPLFHKPALLGSANILLEVVRLDGVHYNARSPTENEKLPKKIRIIIQLRKNV